MQGCVSWLVPGLQHRGQLTQPCVALERLRFSDLYCFALQCRIHKYLLCITTIVWWGRRARTRLQLASVQGLHCHSLPLSLPTQVRTELKCSAPQSLDSTQIFLVKPIFQSMLIQDQLAALVRSKWTPKKVQVSQAFPFIKVRIFWESNKIWKKIFHLKFDVNQ